MRIASVMSLQRGQTDRILAKVATLLLADGVRLAGLVQTNIDRPGRTHCDMDVRVLPSGPVIRINQVLGDNARGCRLDPGALEAAVAAVEAVVSDDVDLLIINKFGKHEAEGRGFRTLIAEALSRGLPVLTGVNLLSAEAFATFSVDLSEALPADVAPVLAWCRAAVRSPVV